MKKILILAGALGLSVLANAQATRSFGYTSNDSAGLSGVAIADNSGPSGKAYTLTTTVTVNRFLSISGSFNGVFNSTGYGAGTSTQENVLQVYHCGDIVFDPINFTSGFVDSSNNPVAGLSLAWLSGTTIGGAFSGFVGIPAAPFTIDQAATSGDVKIHLQRTVSVAATVEPGTYTNTSNFTASIL